MVGFLSGSVAKNVPTDARAAGDTSSISESRRSVEEEMATHFSFPVGIIPMDRGALRDTVYGVTKSQTQLFMHVGRETWQSNTMVHKHGLDPEL